MNNIEISIEGLVNEAIKNGKATADVDINKSKNELLIELHQLANQCIFVTNSPAALAKTIAKNRSLQVRLINDADKIQKSIYVLAGATLLLTIVQLGIAIFHKN